MRLPTIARALAVAALLVTASASAQLDDLKDTTPAERAKAQNAMMHSRLSLTDEQASRVAAINQKYAEKMDPVIKGSSGPLVKMREVKEVERQKEAELKRVLSPEQFEKFLAAKEQMREELEQRIRKQRAAGTH
jgi:Spy/CpxP family protein refolding chaperone